MTHRLRARAALLGFALLLAVPTRAQTADLRLRATAADTLVAGDTLQVVASVLNAGPAAATDVVLVDTLGRRLAPALPLPAPCTASAATPTVVECLLGTLAAGDSATVALSFLTRATGVARHQWSVRSATPDPDTTSNALTLRHVVTPRTALAATLTPSATALTVGRYARFDLVLTNTGTQAARDVQVETVLDGLQAIDDPCASPCSFGTLAPGDTVRARVTGSAAQAGLLFVSALITSPDTEAVTAARTAFVTAASASAFVGLLASTDHPDGWTFRVDEAVVAADVMPGTGTGVVDLTLNRIAPAVAFDTGATSILTATPSLLVATADTAYLPDRLLLILADRPEGPILLAGIEPQLAVTTTPRVALHVAHAATAGSIAVRRIDDTPEHAVLETFLEALDPLQVSDPLALEPQPHVFEIATTSGLPAFVQFALDLTPYAGEPLFLTLVDAPDAEAPLPIVLDITGSPVATRVVTSLAGRGDAPTAFALHPAYPNPFNPTTTLAYDIAAPGRVRLEIFDALGRRVATLTDAVLPAGRYTVAFDAASLPSGMYWATLNAAAFRQSRSLLLVK